MAICGDYGFYGFVLTSNVETTNHLETLFETKSFLDVRLYDNLHLLLQQLGTKINNFLQRLDSDK